MHHESALAGRHYTSQHSAALALAFRHTFMSMVDQWRDKSRQVMRQQPLIPSVLKEHCGKATPRHAGAADTSSSAIDRIAV
jgi:hypothetical protein